MAHFCIAVYVLKPINADVYNKSQHSSKTSFHAAHSRAQMCPTARQDLFWRTGIVLPQCPSWHYKWFISISVQIKWGWEFTVLTDEPQLHLITPQFNYCHKLMKKYFFSTPYKNIHLKISKLTAISDLWLVTDETETSLE